MKRFVTFFISLFIIFVFIALNYLLIDRETLVDQKESNIASINSLSRVNKTLSDDLEAAEEKIKKLTANIEELENKNKELETDIENKNNIVSQLKAKIDIEPIKKEAVKWITLLEGRNMAEAYTQLEQNSILWDNTWSSIQFRNNFLKGIEILEILKNEKEEIDIEIIPSGEKNLEVLVSFKVNIEFFEDEEHMHLKEGENIINLTFDYNETHEKWMILRLESNVME